MDGQLRELVTFSRLNGKLRTYVHKVAHRLARLVFIQLEIGSTPHRNIISSTNNYNNIQGISK